MKYFAAGKRRPDDTNLPTTEPWSYPTHGGLPEFVPRGARLVYVRPTWLSLGLDSKQALRASLPVIVQESQVKKEFLSDPNRADVCL